MFLPYKTSACREEAGASQVEVRRKNFHRKAQRDSRNYDCDLETYAS